MKSYQEEEILKELENDESYPKIYNYNFHYKVGHLELSLFGPSLHDLYEFYEGYDQLTILNINYILQKYYASRCKSRKYSNRNVL